MTTFVLVHGAWLGGWAWQRVARPLRAAGHAVYAPTLTGLGERAHLLREDIDLSVHIRDVVNVLEYEDLRDVVLVGHSYGGLVIDGVARHAVDRVAHLVYLDALIPLGEHRSLAALEATYYPQFWTEFERRIREEGEGWRIPPPPAALFGVTSEAEVRWISDRLMSHPLASWQEELPVPTDDEVVLQRTYILTPTGDGPPLLAPFAEHAKAQGWAYRELRGGHFALFTAPGQLAELLGEVVGHGSRTD